MSRPRSSWTDTEVSVRLRRAAGGAVHVDGALCRAPVWFRWDGATLWQVGSGASPVGEDRVRVRIDVGPGVAVAVRSVAAMVVYAARGGGTSWETEVHVAEGASVDWRPEPVIVTSRANHSMRTTVCASAGSAVTLDESIVFGRENERAGALRSVLDVRVDDEPVLLTSIDSSIPDFDGPSGLDGASVVGHRLRLGGAETIRRSHSSRVAVLEPGRGCRLAVAAGGDVPAVREALDGALAC